MNTNTEQSKPISPPFEQPKRVFPYPAMTITGYVLLAMAFVVTGHEAGYSPDAVKRLLEHVAARSFLALCILMLAFRLVNFANDGMWSRTDMNKGHFNFFLITASVAGVGILLMAQHAFPFWQNWCFNLVAWAISMSMAIEYQYSIAVANKILEG